MLEIGVQISTLFEKLKNTIPNTITIKLTPTWKVPTLINKTSSIGEQIKYYRRLAGIKQADLCAKLGYEKSYLKKVENKEMKLININFIKDIIKELNIEDKININDDYIKFLMDNPSRRILETRRNLKLSQLSFAEKIGVTITTIKKWEKNKMQITRKSYDKIKKYMG